MRLEDLDAIRSPTETWSLGDLAVESGVSHETIRSVLGR